MLEALEERIVLSAATNISTAPPIPVVHLAPAQGSYENLPAVYSGSTGNAIWISEANAPSDTQGADYRVILNAERGQIVAAAHDGVRVAGSGTQQVVLTGSLSNLNNWFSSGFSVNPATNFGELDADGHRVRPESERWLRVHHDRLPPRGRGRDARVTSPVRTATGTPFPVNVSANLIDTDGSESFSEIRFDNIPAGWSFSAGEPAADGGWLVPVSDLAGLTLTPTSYASGTYSLTVSAYSTDSAYFEEAPSQHVASATSTAVLQVRVGEPSIDSLNWPNTPEGTSNFISLAISDPSAVNTTGYTLTLQTTSGTLDIAPSTAARHSVAVTGNGTNSLVLVGNLGDLQALLAATRSRRSRRPTTIAAARHH